MIEYEMILDSADEYLISKIVFLVSCYHGEVFEAMAFIRKALQLVDCSRMSDQKYGLTIREYANTIKEFWKDAEFDQIADKNIWLYGLIAKHSNIDDIKELCAALQQNANIKQGFV